MNEVGIKMALLALFGAILLLTGCGGGGGGGDEPFVAPTLSNSLVSISANNQNAVTDTVDTGVTGAKEGGSNVIGVVIAGPSTSFNAFDFIKSQFSSTKDLLTDTGLSNPTGASLSQNIPCATSGSMTLSAEVADPNGTSLSINDSVGIRFNTCVDGTTTTKGSLSFTVTSGSVDIYCDTNCGDVSIAVDISNLRFTETGQTVAIDGGLNIAKSGTTETLSGSSLYVVVAGGEALHLSDFSISTDSSGPFSEQVSTIDMTIASAVLDGVITVVSDSAAPLRKYYYEDHPHAGKVLVTGANGSQLLIEYLSATAVSLTLDTDGAGPTPAEAPVTVTWDTIQS
jgi:hypothetical protein